MTVSVAFTVSVSLTVAVAVAVARTGHTDPVVEHPQLDVVMDRQFHFDMLGPGMSGHVGQGFAQRGRELVGHGVRHQTVDGPHETDLGFETETATGVGADLEDPGPGPAFSR